MRERTLYIIIGVLIGVIIMQWQQGPQPAQAQTMDVEYHAIAGDAYGNRPAYIYALYPNGDVYRRGGYNTWEAQDPPEYLGNFWGGPPVPTSNETWGSIKAKTK